MIRHSDLIITHSHDGLEFVGKFFPVHQSKIKYIVHPTDELLEYNIEPEKEYDILIWGTIHPYKGVVEFLDYLKESDKLNSYKILISGICPHKDLREKLDGYLKDNKLTNEFKYFDPTKALENRECGLHA